MAIAIDRNQRLLVQQREWHTLEASILQKKIRLHKHRTQFCASLVVLALATLAGYVLGAFIL